MPTYYPFISYENKVKLLTIYPDDTVNVSILQKDLNMMKMGRK